MLHLAFKDLDELIENNTEQISGLIYNPILIHQLLMHSTGFDEYSYFFDEAGKYTIIPLERMQNPQKALEYLSKEYQFNYCCNHGEEAHKFGMKTTDAKKLTETLLAEDKERIKRKYTR